MPKQQKRKQSSTVESQYSYNILDPGVPSIRVLDLLPARHENADIHCSLQTLRLSQSQDDSNAYHALSYVWGTWENAKKIYVDGYSLNITANLEQALRHLRQLSYRKLWIDAICINQTDENEKSFQVAQIRYVYALALEVIVWLGPGDRDTDYAFEFMESLVAAGRKSELEERGSSGVLKPIHQGLTKLFERPWWTRMWVFQEVIVAVTSPIVICGHSQILWDDMCVKELRFNLDYMFGDVGIILRNPRVTGHDEFGKIPMSYLSESPMMAGNPFSLLEILEATCHRLATDPRDKVYAGLGLVSDQRVEPIRPDYGLSVSAVYQTATCNILKAEDCFKILYHLDTEERRSDLPSWCLDFSTSQWRHFFKQHIWYPYHWDAPFRADLQMPKNEVLHDLAISSITLEGIRIGRIISTCHSSFTSADVKRIYPLEDDDTSAVSDLMQKLWSDVMTCTMQAGRSLLTRLSGKEIAGLLAKGLVWRTLMAGAPSIPTSEFELDVEESEDNYWLLERDRLDRSETTNGNAQNCPWRDLVPSISSPGFQRWVINQMMQMVHPLVGTTFFATDSGHIGSSARSVEVGDIACVLFGSKLPVVLQSQGDNYRLASFAYVHDVMDGELVRRKARIRSKIESFRII